MLVFYVSSAQCTHNKHLYFTVPLLLFSSLFFPSTPFLFALSLWYFPLLLSSPLCLPLLFRFRVLFLPLFFSRLISPSAFSPSALFPVCSFRHCSNWSYCIPPLCFYLIIFFCILSSALVLYSPLLFFIFYLF